MSLAISKLGRYAFGLAASGSMALLFAGSASAATLSPVTPTGDSTQISQDTTGTVSDTVTTTATTTVGSVVAIVGPSDGSGGNESGPTPTGKGGAADKAAPTDGSAVAPLVTDADEAAGATALGVTPTEPQPPVAPATTDVVVPPVQPVIISPAVLHHSELTTVTMPQTPVTLALSNPSTPSPAKQPALPKTNGVLLSTITDQLAGTIVPRLMVMLSGVLHPAVPAAAILTYIAILLSLVSITYGQILRRGGFVAAARGDLVNLTFATPVLLDYGIARMPMVLFSGVRDQNKTNLIRSNACEERR